MRYAPAGPPPFDPLAIVACIPTVLAYAAPALPQIMVDSVDVKVFLGVLFGSLGAVLSVWVFFRSNKYHPDSRRLAFFTLLLCVPFGCCGWGALSH